MNSIGRVEATCHSKTDLALLEAVSLRHDSCITTEMKTCADGLDPWRHQCDEVDFIFRVRPEFCSSVHPAPVSAPANSVQSHPSCRVAGAIGHTGKRSPAIFGWARNRARGTMRGLRSARRPGPASLSDPRRQESHCKRTRGSRVQRPWRHEFLDRRRDPRVNFDTRSDCYSPIIERRTLLSSEVMSISNQRTSSRHSSAKSSKDTSMRLSLTKERSRRKRCFR